MTDLTSRYDWTLADLTPMNKGQPQFGGDVELMSKMYEIREVFSQLELAWERGEMAALLTITQVRGSAYRQPGAKMMMTATGKMYGTLSGGCLEADLFEWTRQAMEIHEPRLIQYDLSENDMWSLSIGCKGHLEIAILPLTQEHPLAQALQVGLKQANPLTLILEIPKGIFALYSGTNSLAFGTTGTSNVHEILGDILTPNKLPADTPENLWDNVVHEALNRMSVRTRAEMITMDSRRFYVDTMREPERLILCGAGHDTVPVATAASKMDFAVTILDPRPQFNAPERFPMATHWVAEPQTIAPQQVKEAWWVIMNHKQDRDEQALQLALTANPKYVGILGPLERTQEMLEHIGATLTSGPIHAPVGLNLGGETIDEVGISIVSELLAKRNGADGGHLHLRQKIHG